MIQARPETRPAGHMLWLALAAAFSVPLLAWYVLYPQAGYRPWTLNLSMLMTPALAALLITGMGLGWRRIGLGRRQLAQALVWTAAAYALILVIGSAANAFGAGMRLFRGSYSLLGVFEGWVLAGLGEELMFCGALFTLAARITGRRRWLAVALVALAFALWHLPGFIAREMPMGQTLGRLGLNLSSWLVIGAIYLLSGNLWLAAFAHASTDYGLSPLVTDQPLLGLVFMAVLVYGAWRGRDAQRMGRMPDP